MLRPKFVVVREAFVTEEVVVVDADAVEELLPLQPEYPAERHARRSPRPSSKRLIQARDSQLQDRLRKESR